VIETKRTEFPPCRVISSSFLPRLYPLDAKGFFDSVTCGQTTTTMDKYDIQSKVGDGTYGVVLRAVLKRTGETVAIKKMKQRFKSFEECTRLPEVIALRKLHSCPNVVRLREIYREPSGELSLVFDFMDCDLLAIIRKHKQIGIPPTRIRSMCFQIIQGLATIHKLGYFHRDMKPENILVRREPSGAESVKLADLGLIKETRARPPFTDYVSTRWYRAPEILLQDKAYNSPVDMWAMGCILLELFTGRPLFPGTNEQDQLFKIVTVLGSPTPQSWPEGIELARKLNRRFPAVSPTPIHQLFPHVPPLALDLVRQLLAFNPRQRITAAQALNHPYLQGIEGSEATPRPQVLPRGAVANTAPSPHNKGAPVDWRDITGASPQNPPPATGQAQRPPNPPGTANSFAAGQYAPSGGAGPSVDVLKYASPYAAAGVRGAGGNGANLPPRPAAAAGTDATPSNQKAANDNASGLPAVASAARYGPAAGGFKVAWSPQSNFGLQSPSAVAAARHHQQQQQQQQQHQYGQMQPTNNVPAPTTGVNTGIATALPLVPPRVAAGAPGAGAVGGVSKQLNLRDSFENLFKAAGIDVDEVLARLDGPGGSAATAGAPTGGGGGAFGNRAPQATGTTSASGAAAAPTPRSPTTVGGLLNPARRRSSQLGGDSPEQAVRGGGPSLSPPLVATTTATSPPPPPPYNGGTAATAANITPDESPGRLPAARPGSGHIMHGRRRNGAEGGASPPPTTSDENRAPFGGQRTAANEASPLAKLLGQSRYRTGNAAPISGGAAATGGTASIGSTGNGGVPTTFKSPSFARRPSPLSVNVLQQRSFGGSSSSVLDTLTADLAHRQLFAEETAPPGHDRGVLPPNHYTAAAAGTGAGHHGDAHPHQPLRPTRLHAGPQLGAGGSAAPRT
jgi:serine/threonine protein kinase